MLIDQNMIINFIQTVIALLLPIQTYYSDMTHAVDQIIKYPMVSFTPYKLYIYIYIYIYFNSMQFIHIFHKI